MISISNTFCEHVVSFSQKTAFISLEDGKEARLTYGEMNDLIGSKSTDLKDVKSGEIVLLIYNNTIDFITSFLACQRRGLICVPMFFPSNKRHFERLSGIIESSGSKLALVSEDQLERIKKEVSIVAPELVVRYLRTDCKKDNTEPELNSSAFIQYTSGSTSAPKGVIISQENLTHNQKMLTETFECNEDSVILSWLPFYHDMGLIGSLLHTIYTGCTCVLMRPSSVVKNPMDWFEAIKKYGVTHSGGPNFIFDVCNNLSDEQFSRVDLSSLQVIYNGSEPVKTGTVKKFIQRFSQRGLSESAFRTCYGLAEATLIVSGGIPQFLDDSVSSGSLVSEMELVFLNHETNEINFQSGELCIQGESVTSGYWNIDSSSFFIDHNGKKFLKTGDLGSLENDQLVISGRIKEMLIVNGQNIFPYDLEIATSKSHDCVLENGVSISEKNGELWVFAEIARGYIGSDVSYFRELRRTIDKLLIDSVGVDSEKIVFVTPYSLPRTSSGKIRRSAMHSIWEAGELNEVGFESSYTTVNTFDLAVFDWSEDAVTNYVIDQISQKLRVYDNSLIRQSTLFELGLSSIKAVELVNTINNDLEVDLELSRLYELNNVSKVVEHILDSKWLKSAAESDTEIEL